MRRGRRLYERGRKRRVGRLLLVVCEILRIQRGIGDGVSGSSPIRRLPSLVRRVRVYGVEHARRRHGELDLYIMMHMLHVTMILLLGIEGKRLLRLVTRPGQGSPHLPHVHRRRWPMSPARAHNGRRTLVTILRLRGWCVYGRSIWKTKTRVSPGVYVCLSSCRPESRGLLECRGPRGVESSSATAEAGGFGDSGDEAFAVATAAAAAGCSQDEEAAESVIVETTKRK